MEDCFPAEKVEKGGENGLVGPGMTFFNRKVMQECGPNGNISIY